MKDNHKVIVFFVLVFFLAACSPVDESGNNEGDEDDIEPANVYFINHTSYPVDIYKNFNPQYPTTPLCSVNSGQTRMVEQYASYDQVIGDTFYPRYKIKLADILMPGVTRDILLDAYTDAQSILTNLTFVIEDGKRYDKEIPQPQRGDLRFHHGYLEVQNLGTSQIQVIRGGSPLRRLDNDTLYIDPGHIGYFEIEFSAYSSTINMNQLQAFGNNYYDFPTFTAEKGKLYRFDFRNDNTIAWKNPAERNLDPLQ